VSPVTQIAISVMSFISLSMKVPGAEAPGVVIKDKLR
jgi:hypothetical protein